MQRDQVDKGELSGFPFAEEERIIVNREGKQRKPREVNHPQSVIFFSPFCFSLFLFMSLLFCLSCRSSTPYGARGQEAIATSEGSCDLTPPKVPDDWQARQRLGHMEPTAVFACASRAIAPLLARPRLQKSDMKPSGRWPSEDSTAACLGSFPGLAARRRLPRLLPRPPGRRPARRSPRQSPNPL